MFNTSRVTRQLFSRRGLVALLVCIASLGSLSAIGVSGAGATVGNTPIAHNYASSNGCRVVVGDRPSSAAVGEVDIYGCPRQYYLRGWVAIQHWNGYRWVTEAWRRSRTFVAHGLEVSTGGICGTGQWRTLAQVSYDGGRTWSQYLSSYVNRYPYTTPCQ